MADKKLELFQLVFPNTCTNCGTPISAGYAINNDVAQSGGALCAKCADKPADTTPAPVVDNNLTLTITPQQLAAMQQQPVGVAPSGGTQYAPRPGKDPDFAGTPPADILPIEPAKPKKNGG